MSLQQVKIMFTPAIIEKINAACEGGFNPLDEKGQVVFEKVVLFTESTNFITVQLLEQTEYSYPVAHIERIFKKPIN
jgi:hypothetical protein